MTVFARDHFPARFPFSQARVVKTASQLLAIKEEEEKTKELLNYVQMRIGKSAQKEEWQIEAAKYK
jgi:hypothetical protein